MRGGTALAWPGSWLCSLSCRTRSELGEVTRSTGHGPQRTLYGTWGEKSLGATHDFEEQSAWGGYMYDWAQSWLHTTWTRVHSFFRRPSQQWSSLKFIVTRWDMPVLQSGDVRVLGTPWLWHLSGCTEVRRQLTGRQTSMENYPPKKEHRVKICHAISTLPSQRGLRVLHKAEESCPHAVVAPMCCGGQGCHAGVLCVGCIFQAPRSPSTTLAALICSCGWGRREMCLCNTW